MYIYVYGHKTPTGFVYRIQGDEFTSGTKKGCEKRIRCLHNAGLINREGRDYLLEELKGIKRL